MLTTTLNRKTPPAAAPIRMPALPPVQQTQTGGLDTWLIQYGTVDVAEIQLVFHAGYSREPRTGTSSFAGRLITEGTKQYSALEIAQFFDGYGAFVNVDSGYEITTVSLSVLKRHIPKVLPFFLSVMREATIPEAEFSLQQGRILQQISVEERKPVWQANRRFLHLLFGAEHPYGRHTGREEIMALTAEGLRSFYHSHYNPANAFVVAGGRFDEQELLNIIANEYAVPASAARPPAPTPPPVPVLAKGLHCTPMPGLLQSGVRVGHAGFDRLHPDYHAMRLANLIFGGYFGSRLMSNIREDKGYTYGIRSTWQCLRQGGWLSIATEVGNDFTTDTLKQIRIEMERMRQDSVPAGELDVARNYLLGRIAAGMETPFQAADALKNLLVYGFSLEEVKNGFEAIQSLTADDILRVSQQHFQPEALLEVVCGACPTT